VIDLIVSTCSLLSYRDRVDFAGGGLLSYRDRVDFAGGGLMIN
jgi:hypothetical protein